MIMLSECTRVLRKVQASKDIILKRDCTEMQRKNQNQRIKDMTQN